MLCKQEINKQTTSTKIINLTVRKVNDEENSQSKKNPRRKKVDIGEKKH